MPLREISDFFSITGTDQVILLAPGSCEIDPTRLVGIECHPDDRLIRMHFGASVIDLHFHHALKDGRNLRPEDLYQIKNLLWGASGGDEQRRRPPGSVFRDAQRKHREQSEPTVVPIKPEEKSTPSDRLREAAKAVSVESPLITADALSKLQAQSDEFDRLGKLAKSYNALPAVVDDDYPEMRHMYEACLRDFITALRENGRLGDL